jgi:hypothetical protein
MKWANGKWIQFSYINHLGYECGHYAFISSEEEFREITERYGIKFEDLRSFTINSMECNLHNIKGWFLS